MKKIYVIGGMGAGKSSVSHRLADKGFPLIDLDKLGHEIHSWDVVKDDLKKEFGDGIFDADGSINRRELARLAFASPAATRHLNRITQPRIEELLAACLDECEKQGNGFCVVECSVLRSRTYSIAYYADVVLAVTAPLDERIRRCVASGFDEADVRARIERQISDVDRVAMADFVFENNGTLEELLAKVDAWWEEFSRQ
ncbi:MAG: dephospho-CoA kinase [Eggerthellaceae bacterium]|nr:dephospho-CoA kinase [Eggerthellaceae bacterium]